MTQSQTLLPFHLEVHTAAGVVPFSVTEDPETAAVLEVKRIPMTSSELSSFADDLGIVLQDPTRCGGGSVSSTVGHRLNIRTEDGTALPYSACRHLIHLPKGYVLSRVVETHTNRYRPSEHLNCILSEPSSASYVGGGPIEGEEYYAITLNLVVIYEVNP